MLIERRTSSVFINVFLFSAYYRIKKMERTRDVSPRSIAGSDNRSLSSISTNSQLSEKKSTKSIEEAINETIAEKNARGKEILELTNLLEIEPKSMPKDIQELWAKAAAIMRAEGLSTMDNTTLTLHMQRKNRETINRAREERKLKSRFNNLQNNQTNVLEKTKYARESVDTLQKIVNDESDNNERHVNRMVNAVKLNEYKEFIEKTEESLNVLGAYNYFPDIILEKYNCYLKIQEELIAVEEALSKYNDLPTNLSEARVKLAEKEKYLKDLEHAIFEKMK